MKRYNVQTGWKEIPDNLNPGKVRRYPESKGDIEVIAVNRQTASMCVLVPHIYLGEIVKEISADDPASMSMIPEIPTNFMCGSKLLIAN